MAATTRGPRALPPGIADELTPAEQAHIDSAGAAALETPAPDEHTELAGSATRSDPVAGPDPSDSQPARTPGESRALDEARAARQAAEQRVQQLERLNQTLDALSAGGAAHRPPQDEPERAAIPSFEENRDGHVLGTLARLRQAVFLLAQQRVAERAASAHAAQVDAAWNRARVLEGPFRQAHPDHDAALAHLRQARQRQLEALGMTDPVARDRQLAGELQQIVLRAAQLDLNPAQMLYDTARAVGYAANPAGVPTPGLPAARPEATADDRRRAGGAARRTGRAPLTAERLLEMSDAEFARAIASPEGRALLGT